MGITIIPALPPSQACSEEMMWCCSPSWKVAQVLVIIPCPPPQKKAVEQWEEGQEALSCFLLRPVLLNMDLCLAVSEALSTRSLELHEIGGITHFTHEKSGACASITDPVIAGQDWISLDAHRLPQPTFSTVMLS